MTVEPLFLTVEDVLDLHAEQLERYGGLSGVRDRGALESAVETPRATFDGAYLHSSLFEMGAAYAFHIAESQSLMDGNKRTGLNAALVFLLINGWEIQDKADQLHPAMIALADGTMSKSDLADLLERLAAPDQESDAF